MLTATRTSLRRGLRDLRRVGPGLVLRTLAHLVRRPWQQARFDLSAPGPARIRSRPQTLLHLVSAMLIPPKPFQQPLGAVTAVVPRPQGLALAGAGGALAVEFFTGEIIRLTASREPSLPDAFSYAAVLEPQPVAVAIDLGDPITLVTATARVDIRRQDGRIDVTVGGKRLLAGLECGWDEKGAWLRHQLAATAQCFGLGERAFPVALRGRSYQLITRDPEGYGPGDDPLYLNIPFLIEYDHGQAAGLFFDSTYRAEIDLAGPSQPEAVAYHTTGPDLHLDLLLGPTLPQTVEQFTALSGRMPLPPLWALGYHQSRWSYETAAIVRDIARQFRQRRLPCEAIHLDIDYMDGFRCFTWDGRAFPDPAGLIDELHRQGFRAVAMIDPGIKADPAYRVCAEGMAQDCFVKLPDGSLANGPVWPGECYFPDFTNPRVRAWWGEQYRELVEAGVDGFWNDMNEPTIFGKSTLPDAARYDFEGRGGDHRQAQSIYGMQMVRATAEGLDRLRPGQRNWVFTRSGYAGVQRYASSWTADNTSSWQDLRLTPAMLLNLGLSGLSFTGCDIGGFIGEPTPELFARWISMGAFTPFFRSHSAKETPPQEPWVYGSEVEAIARAYLGHRYRLLPALYTAFWQCAHRGTPIMRPLLYERDDPAYETIDDQWLLGDHLLVSPVLAEGSRQRRLLLPPGGWYDFWSDELLAGPAAITRPAPLDLVPLHIRAGAVLPLGPVRQHSAEAPAVPLQLHLYPGDGVSWLYEDDGHSLAYRQGDYRLSRFDLSQRDHTLTLVRSLAGDFHPPYPHFEIAVHGAQPLAAHLDGVEWGMAAAGLTLPAGGWRRLDLQLVAA